MDVLIDRCRLRGREVDLQRARRALTHCPWPSVADGEIVILRRVAVRASPPALPQRLFSAADRLIAARVDGWSDAAVDADCVVFRSEAELLARLSLDLALGRARGLWFWQSYRRFLADPASGLPALWQEHAPRLPALVAELRRRGRLAAVWRRLDDRAAGSLLPRVMPPALAALLSPEHASPPAPVPAAEHPVLAGLRLQLAAFGDDRPGTTAAPARRRLAVALTLAEVRPHWLAAGALPAWTPRLLDDHAPPAAPSPLPPGSGRGPATIAAGSGIDIVAPLPAAGVPPAPPAAPTPGQVSRSEPPAADLPAGQPATGMPEPRHEKQAPDEPTPGADTAAEPPGDPGAEPPTWSIRQGGLFLLLNLLQRPDVRERLLHDADALAFPSGWGWLYRVGEVLGLAPEPALERCLASLAGMAPERFPLDLPPLAAAPDIAELGAARYGRVVRWGPALLQRPALIVHRRPELDLSFAMTDLDLDVRRAALDVDPGWVDWLGCWVRFHYRDRPPEWPPAAPSGPAPGTGG